jgi:hypothetical protein
MTQSNKLIEVRMLSYDCQTMYKSLPVTHTQPSLVVDDMKILPLLPLLTRCRGRQIIVTATAVIL